MALVIAVINTKGGVGKTTVSINLADAAHRDGTATLLIDSDPQQGSATRWKRMAESRGKDSCRVVTADSDLGELLEALGPHYDWIVIDGPPRLERASTMLVSVADLVLLPIQPSALDLWACGNALTWIEERQMLTGGPPQARFLLSRCHPDDRVNRDDTAALLEAGVPVLSSRTAQRVGYARTLGRGETALDLPEDDKARREVLQIYKEISNVCCKL